MIFSFVSHRHRSSSMMLPLLLYVFLAVSVGFQCQATGTPAHVVLPALTLCGLLGRWVFLRRRLFGDDRRYSSIPVPARQGVKLTQIDSPDMPCRRASASRRDDGIDIDQFMGGVIVVETVDLAGIGQPLAWQAIQWLCSHNGRDSTSCRSRSWRQSNQRLIAPVARSRSIPLSSTEGDDEQELLKAPRWPLVLQRELADFARRRYAQSRRTIVVTYRTT